MSPRSWRRLELGDGPPEFAHIIDEPVHLDVDGDLPGDEQPGQRERDSDHPSGDAVRVAGPPVGEVGGAFGAFDRVGHLSPSLRYLQLGRRATVDELSDFQPAPLDRLDRVPFAEHSLDEPMAVFDFDDGDTYEARLEDESTPSPEQAANDLDRRAAVEAALDIALTDREKAIIRHQLGVSKKRIRQIELAALAKLMHPAVRERLAPYVRDLPGIPDPDVGPAAPPKRRRRSRSD